MQGLSLAKCELKGKYVFRISSHRSSNYVSSIRKFKLPSDRFAPIEVGGGKLRPSMNGSLTLRLKELAPIIVVEVSGLIENCLSIWNPTNLARVQKANLPKILCRGGTGWGVEPLEILVTPWSSQSSERKFDSRRRNLPREWPKFASVSIPSVQWPSPSIQHSFFPPGLWQNYSLMH